MRSRILCGVLIVGACGCSPSLDTPEGVADAYAKFRIKEIGIQTELRLKRDEQRIEFVEAKRDLWIGTGTLTQMLDVRRARFEFTQEHLSEIQDNIVYDIVDVKDLDPVNKRITITFWIYDVKTGDRNPKAFYLDYKPKVEWIEVTKVSGQWRIQRTSADTGGAQEEEPPPERREGRRGATCIDVRFKLFVELPANWGIVKTLCSVKDATSDTGLRELPGGQAWRIAEKDERGGVKFITDQRVTVFAVPKDKAEFFEQNKWDRGAVRGFPAGDYVVFTDAGDATLPGVKKVLETLKYQP